MSTEHSTEQANPTETEAGVSTPAEPLAEDQQYYADEQYDTDAPEAEFEPYTAEELGLVAQEEGQEIDEELRDQFLDFINEGQFSPAHVGQMLAFQDTLVQRISERLAADADAQNQEWVRTLESDPEIGGPRLESTLAGISKLLDTYGNDEVRDAFDMTGAGNHPAIVKFLHAVAKAANEPGAPAPGGGEVQQKSVAEILFPSMKGGR